jgi:hypothetical protein
MQQDPKADAPGGPETEPKAEAPKPKTDDKPAAGGAAGGKSGGKSDPAKDAKKVEDAEKKKRKAVKKTSDIEKDANKKREKSFEELQELQDDINKDQEDAQDEMIKGFESVNDSIGSTGTTLSMVGVGIGAVGGAFESIGM